MRQKFVTWIALAGMVPLCLAACGKIRTLARSTAVAPLNCSYGGSWTTLFDDPSSLYGAIQPIGIDLVGNLFAGPNYLSGTSHFWTLKSALGSGAWTVSDDVVPPGASTDGFLGDYAVDAKGAMYAVGGFYSAGYYSHWFVRKTVDAGATWATVDDYTYQDFGGNGGVATTMTIDTNGDLYVTGYGLDSVNHYVAVVRRSKDSGSTWTTVDHFQLAANQDSGLNSQLVKTATGHFLYTSLAPDGAGISHGIQRRSIDGGASFTTVSDYSPTPGKNFYSQANLIAADGSYLLAGQQNEGATDDSHWQVLRSTDEGVTFTIVDDYLPMSGVGPSTNIPLRMMLDARGYVYVAGLGFDATGVHAIIRQSKNGASDWSTAMDFVYPGSDVGSNFFYGIKMDHLGNLYAAGGFAVGGIYRGLVLKQSCN